MHQGGAVMKSCDCHVTCWYRDKERKYEERVKEVEKSFQQEMESMRESTKSTMLRLEADNARLRSEEEKLRDEIKHDRTVSGPLCQLLWCVGGGGEGTISQSCWCPMCAGGGAAPPRAGQDPA